MKIDQFKGIAMFLVTSPIVIIVPTRGLLAVETMHAIVQWLANLNIKRNMTSMFVNKKHCYTDTLVDRRSKTDSFSRGEGGILKPVLEWGKSYSRNLAKLGTFRQTQS